MDHLDSSSFPIAKRLSNLNEIYDEYSIVDEIQVIQEWEGIQMQLINGMLNLSLKDGDRCRDRLEEIVDRCTQGQAKIQWEPDTQAAGDSRGLVIRSQQRFYGTLHMSAEYLVSRLLPSLPQRFANLCALFLTLAEYQALVYALLKPLQPLEALETLTPRQAHVLQHMARGENEMVIAAQLNLSVTTIRTHRQHIYNKLNVHSSQEAILRSFEEKLLDWTYWPYPDFS